MATAFDVNLTITSAVGYRRSTTSTFLFSGTPTIGGVDGPRPIMTTTLTLNGNIQPDIAITGTRILSVTTTTDFYTSPGLTSSPQTISVYNLGNSTISFTGTYFLFSGNGVLVTLNNFDPPNLVILPGTTATFDVSYTGVEVGQFYNYLVLLTNADNPQYKIVTKQIVSDTLGFTVTPGGFSTSSVVAGFKTTATYTINPTLNGVSAPGAVIPIVKTLATSTLGWSLVEGENNQLFVSFNANLVNNNTGTYVSTLTLTYDLLSYNLVNTVNLNVDTSDDYNLGSWISAPSPYDSIIGVSYDVVNNQRCITIGVGAAGEGVPLYGLGGSEYIDVENLNFDSGYKEVIYPYWGKVFRIPLPDIPGNQPRTYYSKDYLVKNQGPEYVSYFGENLAPGSMFIVEDDGYHNVVIKINHLRELPLEFMDSITVRNLTRAFYYYSGVDLGGGRYYQLEPILPDENSTHLFVGFNNQGGIIDYPVNLPTL